MDDKCTKTYSEKDGESDTEIDVVNVTDASQLIAKESCDGRSCKEKRKSQKMTDATTKNRTLVTDVDDDNDDDDDSVDDEEVEVIDVDGVEEETFLTIGNVSRPAKINTAVDKSPLPTQVDSFVMSESLVLEGTKHKSMSPEFGSSSDGQDEPALKANKSRIPVPKKGFLRTKAAPKRATKGRKKTVAEEPQSTVSVVGQGDDEEDERGLTVAEQEKDRPLQGKGTRGRKKKVVEEPQSTVSRVGQGDDEEDERGLTIAEQENDRPLQGKGTRGRKKKAMEEPQSTVSRVGQGDDEEDERGLTIAEQEKDRPLQGKGTRGRKKKDLEGQGVGQDDDEEEDERAFTFPEQEQDRPLQGKGTRGRKKKNLEEPVSMASGVGHDDDEEDERAFTFSEQEQDRSLQEKGTRGRKKKNLDEPVSMASGVGHDDDEEDERAFTFPEQEQDRSLQEKSARGRKKKATEEPKSMGSEDEDEDEDKGLPNSRQHQSRSTRSGKQKADKMKPSESEAVETRNIGSEEKSKTRARSLPATKQLRQKSIRKRGKTGGESRGVESDGEDNNDQGDTVVTEHETKKGRGRKSVPCVTQQIKRATRGRKQISDSKNIEEEGAEENNVDPVVEKSTGRKTRAKKEAERRKKMEQKENMGKESEQQDGGRDPTELRGRKTRAQKKREQDAQLDRRNGGEEEEELGVVVDNLDIETVESENVESVETVEAGLETEEAENDENVSTVQRKGKGRQVKKSNELINDANLTQGYSKRGGRKSQGAVREQQLEQTERQDLSEEGDDASERKRGNRRTAPSQDEETNAKENSDVLDVVEDLYEEQNDGVDELTGQMSSNEHEKTNDASVSRMSSASSNASSSTESARKANNGVASKRRKRSRVLPPYVMKRVRASKANGSKNSSGTDSHDSTEFSVDAKKRRLQDEGNETSPTKNSLKKGSKTNARQTGRNKRAGRKSEGEKTSMTQGNENSTVDVNDSVQEATGADNSLFETPAQPVTALKSILKSGGSAGRTPAGNYTCYDTLYRF